MKNKLLISASLLFTLIGVSGCNSNSSESSSVISTSNSQITSSSSSSSSDTKAITFLDDVTISEEDKVSELGSISGIWIDLAIGTHLVVGKTYNSNINKPSSVVGGFHFTYKKEDGSVNTSSPISITQVGDSSSNQYQINVSKEGGVILEITDDDDYLYYRNAINCRRELSLEDATRYMSDQVDYWNSMYPQSKSDNYRIVFEDSSHAILRSVESGSLLPDINMELTYSTKTVSSDANEYVFSVVSSTDSESETSLNPTTLTITTCCDMIHLSDKIGLVAFFNAVNL